MNVKVKKLDRDAIVPKYQSTDAAGFDFHTLEEFTLRPGETKKIETGLAFEIPRGFEIQVRPRSGNSLKTKMRVANSPGTIDADFRGHVCIIIDHIGQLGDPPISMKRGDRIAQGVLVPVYRAEFIEVNELGGTERKNGGFGSTGQSTS